MLGNWQPASAWPSAGARRADLERGAGIALTVLLHAVLLLFLLHVRTPSQTKQKLSQSAAVVDMQLIPQALVTPAAVSQPRPRAQAKPKPNPRPIPPKPDTAEPAPSPPVPPAPVSTPTPAPATPPPQPASAGIVEPLPLAYLRRVMMTIGINRRYPLKALANREEGTVVVHMHLARDGSVLDVSIIRSSGYASLDAEAVDVVWRIANFQPLPPEYARGAPDFSIDQPIRFTGY